MLYIKIQITQTITTIITNFKINNVLSDAVKKKKVNYIIANGLNSRLSPLLYNITENHKTVNI